MRQFLVNNYVILSAILATALALQIVDLACDLLRILRQCEVEATYKPVGGSNHAIVPNDTAKGVLETNDALVAPVVAVSQQRHSFRASSVEYFDLSVVENRQVEVSLWIILEGLIRNDPMTPALDAARGSEAGEVEKTR